MTYKPKVRLKDTEWNDIFIPIAGAKVPAANAPTWSAFTANLNSYTFAIDDYLDLGTAEILHGYKEETDIGLHVHFITNGLDADERTVKFTLHYSWGNPADVMDAESSLTAEYTIPASTTDKTNFSLYLGAITGTGKTIQSLFKCRIERIASTGTEPASDPFVEMVGIHYEIDTIGSATATSKF